MTVNTMNLDLNLNYMKRISSAKAPTAILRAILPGDVKALIIGRRGHTIEELKRTFHVVMHIDGQKILQTRGEPSNIAKSWSRCLKLIYERNPMLFEQGRISVSFLLTAPMLQYLEAVDGFRKIAADGGVEIRVHRQPLMPNCTEHIVTLTVADVHDIDRSFENCLHGLCDALACNPGYALSFPGTEFYVPTENDVAFLSEASKPQQDDDLVYGSF